MIRPPPRSPLFPSPPLSRPLINRARPPQAPPLTVSALPMDDAPTYALLKSCRTTAVFQLESRGMKDLIRRLQPDRKSTRLNSSHSQISYAVFCLKKKKEHHN